MGKCATAFKDIGKTCSDLLTKDFKVNQSTVEVKSKTSNGVEFKPTAEKKGDKFSGSLVAKYGFLAGIDGEITAKTNGIVEASFEGSPTKGVKVTLDCTRPEPSKPGFLSSAKCTAEYVVEALNLKSSYEAYGGALHGAGTFVYDAFTLGCSADYSTQKGALSSFGAACQFVQPDFSVIGKLTQKTVGKGNPMYTGMYYHKVSGDMQVGAELSHTTGKELGLAFGGAYKLDKDTTVKGKVDAEGMLYSSYKQKISSLTTMTLAAQIDTVNLSDNKHKFGMVLNITA